MKDKATAKNDVQVIMEEQLLGETKAVREFETIKVEGSYSKAYAELMKHHPANDEEKQFISRLEEAVHSLVTSFEVPVCDPSIDDDGKIQFVPGFKLAVGYSYNELEKLAKENGLRLGNKDEYILFLGTLINSLIAKGWSEAYAWHAVCTDSEKIGYYKKYLHEDFGLTGSRKIAGKCDLANTYKILAKDEKAGGFWEAGGFCNFRGICEPVAFLYLRGGLDCFVFHNYHSVGWFVL